MFSSLSGQFVLYRILCIILWVLFCYFCGKRLNIITSIDIKEAFRYSSSNNSLLPTLHCNSNHVDRTLLVLSGQLRDFIHIWQWTYSSLVEPNEPCDVIFSIHGSRVAVPDIILKGFGHHILAILTTDTETPVGRIEFWLTARAIKNIHPECYAYVIKTRPDLFHRLPISMKTIYGKERNFICSLWSFHKTLLKKTGKKNLDVAETLYAWIMTAGLVELIPTMILRTPVTVWAKLAPNDWNKNIRATLHNHSKIAAATMEESNTVNDKKILEVLHLTLKRHKVVYNFGSTWLQFGPSEHMVPAFIKTAEQYGQHTWADVGFNDSDTLNENQWRDVTESQLRLTYLKGGYNLIDIIHEPDLVQSFLVNQTFRQAKEDASCLFFIVRSQENYKRLWNLTAVTNITYW